MVDLTPIAEAFIAVMAALVSAFVIPYIKKKTTSERRAEMSSWISMAVTAAEQIYSGTGRGVEKKEYVLNFLYEKGFSIDTNLMADTVDTLIEAAVFELKK